jgi:hypothetical protein
MTLLRSQDGFDSDTQRRLASQNALGTPIEGGLTPPRYLPYLCVNECKSDAFSERDIDV